MVHRGKIDGDCRELFARASTRARECAVFFCPRCKQIEGKIRWWIRGFDGENAAPREYAFQAVAVQGAGMSSEPPTKRKLLFCVDKIAVFHIVKSIVTVFHYVMLELRLLKNVLDREELVDVGWPRNATPTVSRASGTLSFQVLLCSDRIAERFAEQMRRERQGFPVPHGRRRQSSLAEEVVGDSSGRMVGGWESAFLKPVAQASQDHADEDGAGEIPRNFRCANLDGSILYSAVEPACARGDDAAAEAGSASGSGSADGDKYGPAFPRQVLPQGRSESDDGGSDSCGEESVPGMDEGQGEEDVGTEEKWAPGGAGTSTDAAAGRVLVKLAELK